MSFEPVGLIDTFGETYHPSMLGHSLPSAAQYANVTGPIRVPRHNIPSEPVGSIDAFGETYHPSILAHSLPSAAEYVNVTGPIQVLQHPLCNGLWALPML